MICDSNEAVKTPEEVSGVELNQQTSEVPLDADSNKINVENVSDEDVSDEIDWNEKTLSHILEFEYDDSDSTIVIDEAANTQQKCLHSAEVTQTSNSSHNLSKDQLEKNSSSSNLNQQQLETNNSISNLSKQQVETNDYKHNVISQADLFDDPHTGKTLPTLAGNFVVKSGFVWASLAVVFVPAAFFLNAVMRAKLKTAPEMVKTTPKPETIVPQNRDEKEAETGKLKAEMALGKQAEQIRAVEAAKSPKLEKIEPSTSAKPSPTATIKASPTPTPPQAVRQEKLTPPRNYQNTPQPVHYALPPPPKTEPRRVPMRQPSPVVSVARVSPQPLLARSIPRHQAPKVREVIQQRVDQQVDPMEQWLAMSRLGSYGSGSALIREQASLSSATNVVTLESDKQRVSSSIHQYSVPANTQNSDVAVTPRVSSVGESSISNHAQNSDVTVASKRSFLGESSIPNHIQNSNVAFVSRVPSVSHKTLNPAFNVALKAPSINNYSASTTPNSDVAVAPKATRVEFNNESTANTNILLSHNQQALTPDPNLEQNILAGIPLRQLRVGMAAKAKLETPMVWAGVKSAVQTKSNNESGYFNFVVRLIQPILDDKGYEILPAGSSIVAVVDDIHSSGYATVQATRLLVDGQEYVLPPGAISITASSGNPLIASKWGDKGGEIAKRDATAFLFGSLAQVGKLLNEPQETSSFNSVGIGGSTSTTSTKRGQPNLLGAVLEGGFEPLTQQILARNQAAINEMQESDDVWYIRAGTDVQVTVNQSFEL